MRMNARMPAVLMVRKYVEMSLTEGRSMLPRRALPGTYVQVYSCLRSKQSRSAGSDSGWRMALAAGVCLGPKQQRPCGDPATRQVRFLVGLLCLHSLLLHWTAIINRTEPPRISPPPLIVYLSTTTAAATCSCTSDQRRSFPVDRALLNCCRSHICTFLATGLPRADTRGISTESGVPVPCRYEGRAHSAR